MYFFFNDTATTEIYTLSLHDALPICFPKAVAVFEAGIGDALTHLSFPGSHHAKLRTTNMLERLFKEVKRRTRGVRSEEHTSELQSRQYLVCRLLLEKKKTNQ